MPDFSLRRVVKEILRPFYRIGTSWVANRSFEHLENIRLAELDFIISKFPPNARVLEIGAGTGWQARWLADHGFSVSAVDIVQSNYREDRVWNVIDYDGHILPFPDNSFDLIFSSNVLEHIPHILEFQKEIIRVLSNDGLAIHLMPSSSWRFFTNLTAMLRWRIPNVHGEHARGPWHEIWVFRKQFWIDIFESTGWAVVERDISPVFYTGESIFDYRITVKTRKKLARIFGGSCSVLVLKKKWT